MHRNSVSVRDPGTRDRLHRTTAEERAQWQDRFLKSGQTRKVFAATHGLTLSTIQRWFRQSRTVTAAPKFREFQIAPSLTMPSASWDAEVQLVSGTCVRLRGELARTVVNAVLPKEL